MEATKLGDPVSDISGEWKNELGSVMYITATSDGKISGTYFNGVGPQTGPVTGTWQNTSNPTYIITFIVTWQKPASTTAWNGTLYYGGQGLTISTMWQLVQDVPVGNLWSSTLTNQDTFTKLSSKTDKV